MVNRREGGGEVVQAVVAMPLVILVVFAAVQVGGMMLTTHRLAADLTRACRQIDVAGIALAQDREEFVKLQVLGAASQLQPERLHVEKVTLAFDENLGRAGGPAAAGSSGGAGGEAALSASQSSLGQRTSIARISFDLAYDLPLLMELPGLPKQRICRQVECSPIEGRVMEVEVKEP